MLDSMLTAEHSIALLQQLATASRLSLVGQWPRESYFGFHFKLLRVTFLSSADVFDFLHQRIMHHIKMTINIIKQSTPTMIPAIAPPVRSRKEK